MECFGQNSLKKQYTNRGERADCDLGLTFLGPRFLTGIMKVQGWLRLVHSPHGVPPSHLRLDWETVLSSASFTD